MSIGHERVSAQTRSDIEELVYEHSALIDHHQSARLYELYTETGRLIGIGMNHVGREALKAYGTKRATLTDRFARHLYSNLRLRHVTDDRIEGQATITLYRHDGAGGLPEANAVADVHDIFVRGADGRWLFEERRLELVLESAAHAAAHK